MSQIHRGKVLGFWSGHDASACVLEDGKPVLHLELERHSRIKEGAGDSIALLKEHYSEFDDVAAITTCYLPVGIMNHHESWDGIKDVAPLYVCGHHESHAAHAFYSSNFEKALILTTDGGGIENQDGFCAGITAWSGINTRLHNIFRAPLHISDVGGIWSRCTRYIFGLESGAPFGNQAGSVMAFAAYGEPKYIDDFRTFFRHNMQNVTSHPPGHVRGMSAKDPQRPRHHFLGQWEDIAKRSEQDKCDLAASLQLATEEFIRSLIGEALKDIPNVEYLCMSGGVSLNSVMTGKIRDWFPQLKGVYIPPVPYDGGLTIGSAQWTWHHVLGNPRVKWDENFTPYLGASYVRADLDDALKNVKCDVDVMSDVDESFVCERLAEGAVISVFNGRAESGRRALGNRSIIADPRRADMKDRVNLKIKNRDALRPFAPSILKEYVGDWFDCSHEINSPYMEFVKLIKQEKRHLIPAVCHKDGSARLQTVSEKDNPWYHRLLTAWNEKSGVPILLNTSLNSQSPIVETPAHAFDCFARTDLDFVYFPEWKILVAKRK